MSTRDTYQKKIQEALAGEFQYMNLLAVPHIEKIVLNVGTGKALADTKTNAIAEETLRRITGQKPVSRESKKAISNFKLRKGIVIGWKVTLRGKRMIDFLEKLVRVSLPRIRDFRGISPRAVDAWGNLTIGFREHLVFPEIQPDEVEQLHGLEVTIVTTARTQKEGLAFFTALGFPFQKEQSKK